MVAVYIAVNRVAGVARSALVLTHAWGWSSRRRVCSIVDACGERMRIASHLYSIFIPRASQAHPRTAAGPHGPHPRIPRTAPAPSLAHPHLAPAPPHRSAHTGRGRLIQLSLGVYTSKVCATRAGGAERQESAQSAWSAQSRRCATPCGCEPTCSRATATATHARACGRSKREKGRGGVLVHAHRQHTREGAHRGRCAWTTGRCRRRASPCTRAIICSLRTMCASAALTRVWQGRATDGCAGGSSDLRPRMSVGSTAVEHRKERPHA